MTDTNVDFAVGTPGYICPEQVRGEEMDHRGDLYSVGVMMFELLTGRLPFTGPNSMDILLAHATEPPPTFSEVGLRGWVPKEVERLVFECLAKDPEDRPQSAKELAERFDTALDRARIKVESDPGGPACRRGFPGSGVWPPAAYRALACPAVPRSPRFPRRPLPAPREAAMLPFQMEAWMPESIAIVKLRGFVHDAGGEVVESLPGLIRVRLKGGGSSWFGLRRAGAIDVELHLTNADPSQPNKLIVHVYFRPSHASLLADQAWQQRCTDIFIQIRSYLMGRSE